MRLLNGLYAFSRSAVPELNRSIFTSADNGVCADPVHAIHAVVVAFDKPRFGFTGGPIAS
jgi:hypothetical protein